ncbi:MAG: site-specific integrase [Clostridiales bacterium]|nr:site-specific integrase [Clostridiales bacterium]
MPIYKMEGKKDGLQRYRVRINYTDNTGKAHQLERVAYGKEEAKELEAQMLKSLKEAASPGRITLNELYDEYINTKQHEVRETTLSKIKNRLEHHVIPKLGKYRIDKITLPILQNWKNSLNRTKLSLTTKRGIYGELRALLNYAVKMEYIPKNPVVTVGNFKDAYEGKHNIDFYTPEEFKKFISAAKNQAEDMQTKNGSITEWNYYIFFNIAFYTGLRKGEIHALKWTDIDNNILNVTRSIAQKLKGEDRETPPKNRSSIRSIQLPLPLINILNEHYARCSMIDGFSDEWRICGGLKCLRDTTIQNKNIKYSQSAEIKTIRIHDFRHSHASVLANNGINIQEIARRLGHSKVEITWNIYSHLYPKEEERAVQILNKIV